MKRMTCRDLGGPCDAEFTADTFEDIGKKCHGPVMEQMQKGDEAHLSAANKMRLSTPEQQSAIMTNFKRKFDDAPNV